MPELDTLDDIKRVAAKLLRRADVDEMLPTPVERIVAVAGLEQSDVWMEPSRIAHATDEARKMLRSASRKILGTLDRRDRVIYVSPEVEGKPRGRFVKLHETMHDQLPWQDTTIFADNHVTLSPTVERIFEREANQGAAELLFQNDLFTRVARDYPTSLDSPAELAAMFGASLHASVRRWVEGHQRRVCVAVMEPNPAGTAPLWYRRSYLIQSPQWSSSIRNPWLTSTMSAREMPFLAELVDPWPTGIDTTWEVDDVNGDPVALRVQSLATPYNVFLMLAAPGRDGLVARHRKKPTLVVAR
jgi:hypothetical protein